MIAIAVRGPNLAERCVTLEAGATPGSAPASGSAPAPGAPPACPAEWSRLARTDRADVRACGACGQRVFYCATLDEARGHAQRGHAQRGAPVAVDARTGRTRDDLAPR